jgi:hypothetical protein
MNTEKQQKLNKILKKVSPTQTTNIQDLVAELTILRAKMRYLEHRDWESFQDVQEYWDKCFLSDSDEDSSDEE